MSIRFESSFVVEASVLLDEDEMKLILLVGSIHILRNRTGGRKGSKVTIFAHLQHYIYACSLLIFRKSLLFTLSSDNLLRYLESIKIYKNGGG